MDKPPILILECSRFTTIGAFVREFLELIGESGFADASLELHVTAEQKAQLDIELEDFKLLGRVKVKVLK